MAYLGSKTGAQLLASQNRAQAMRLRANAKLLAHDPDLPGESKKVIAEAEKLEAEAASALEAEKRRSKA